MKLGSLRAGGRDGTLIVVSRDLTRAVGATGVAPTLQSAIDNWSVTAPRLQRLYDELNAGKAKDAFPLVTADLAAPLPRAYQFADGSAYVRHVELVRKARGGELPPKFWTDPLIYQACSDRFMGPNDPIEIVSEAHGVDFEAELVAITDDVPMGTKEAAAGKHLILYMLVNDVSLRNLIPAELEKGLGFFHGKPTSAFSPVAVTPDEFGDAFDGKTVHLPLISTLRGQKFGWPSISVDQVFTLARLVEHCAVTRHLGAGSLIGTGTISNVNGNCGSSCIAEVRAHETITQGKPVTPYMAFGDRIRIEMFDRNGNSIFGAIDQTTVHYTPPGDSGA
jgi:fumarylacetoacetate (FAA) hydrolase